MSKEIWDCLINAGMTSAGAAGMMGNMYAESGLISNRVEILCLKRLKEKGKYYTDATYTAFVDDGTISKAEFLNPLPGKQYGYGLCQWTSPSRKSGLYNLAKSRKTSIGDMETQLEFLIGELQASYPSVWQVLTTAKDVKAASDKVLVDFEIPDNAPGYKEQRYQYSIKYYEEFAERSEAMTEAQAIDKVLSIAAAEVGYLEKASAANLDSETANPGSGNYTKYNRDMHNLQPTNMDYPAAWCDAFCDWCFYKAFGAELARKVLCGTFDDYTVNSAGYYKNAGRWTTKAARGHQIFFKNSGGICHTGLVWKVESSTVYTIEGNAQNAVRAKQYSVNDASIAGYGMPRYNLVAGTPDTPVTPSAPDHKYTGDCTAKAVQLIKGDYGPAVKALQALLNLKGYKGKDGKALTVDGEFGANTEYAVSAFQKAVGMTGINFGTVSTMTWQQLIL